MINEDTAMELLDFIFDLTLAMSAGLGERVWKELGK